MTQTEREPSAEQATRGRGRPPKNEEPLRNREVDAAAAALAQKRLIPRPPARKLTFDEMQEWMKLLTADMWSHVLCYLYRIHPRIIRQLKNPDSPKYIDCISQPFDLDYVIQNHGGGKYSFTVVDTDQKMREAGNKLFECDFEIPLSQHDPKLAYEELDINHRANMAYVQLLQYRGILDSKGQVMATQPNGSATGVQADIVKEVLSFAKQVTTDKEANAAAARSASSEQTLNKAVGDILIEKMKQDDPNKNLVGLLAIIKEVLATNKPADGSTQFLQQVLTMTSQHQQTVLTLFEKMTEARRNEPSPQMEQFSQLLEFSERLSGFRGGGGRRSGWDIGLDYAQQLGVPLLNLIGNMMSLRNNGRPMPSAAGMAQPGATPPAAPPGAFDPYANPGALRAFSQAAAAAQSAIPQASANVNPQITQVAQVIQAYGGLVVQHLNSGTPGWQFGDWVAALMGNATHAQIAAHGPDALVAAMLSFPETAMYGEPRIRRFVDEFINYEQYLPAEDGDETAEEAGAAAR